MVGGGGWGGGGGGCFFFFFQAEDGIRDAQESRGLGDVYKRQESRGLTCSSDIYDSGMSSFSSLMILRSPLIWN